MIISIITRLSIARGRRASAKNMICLIFYTLMPVSHQHCRRSLLIGMVFQKNSRYLKVTGRPWSQSCSKVLGLGLSTRKGHGVCNIMVNGKNDDKAGNKKKTAINTATIRAVIRIFVHGSIRILSMTTIKFNAKWKFPTSRSMW